jgi:ribonucleotide reductase beta subunit family protein with ferritin-like domain
MKHLFNKEIVDKYSDIINRLNEKEEQKNIFLKNFYKKSKKKENKIIQNYKENLVNEKMKKKRNNFWSMMFHTTMFFGSGIALYFLYKNRKNFI